MSRDIRSYFAKSTSKSSAEIKKPRKINRLTISSSDEEESNNSPIKFKGKTTKSSVGSKKNVNDSSDSSDDKIHKNTKSQAKTTEKGLTSVNVNNIFGRIPIKSTDTLPVPKKLKKEEALTHDDDDFEATLNEVDLSVMDAMYSEDVTETKTNGKRKKPHESTSDDDTLSKKLKLNDNKKIINKNGNQDEEPHQSNHDKSIKLNVRKNVKGSHEKHPKLNVVIEKKPDKRKVDNEEDKFDPLEEHIAKKKQHLEAYQAYLQRGGARNPGSKPIPDGAENCLAGLSFVVTGIMDSLERDEMDQLIEKYGGRILKAISKKVDYLIVGEMAGESKLAKAKSYNIKQISEDDLLDMIRTRPADKASKISLSRIKKKEKSPPIISTEPIPTQSSSSEQKSPEKVESKFTKFVKLSQSDKDSLAKKIEPVVNPKKFITCMEPNIEMNFSPIQAINNNMLNDNILRVPYIGETQALVEKYRPKQMKQIIGQHGEKSPAKKFYTWLQNWHKNHNSKVKHTKTSSWAKNEDGSFFKACLLSGPPGVGKTTTVQVVCDELGFDLLEFNASDTRSKRLLKEEISSLLSNTTVKGFYTNNSVSKKSDKPVLLMDEVDGMAGNEDRGGLQELITLIKTTEIPIVCICNDRSNPKMRTLSNYTFDLRFQKPRIEQIRGAMKSLCCKENITIATENLDRLIYSSNQDIRQVINHLAMYVNTSSRKNNDEKNDTRVKDLKIGPWDVVRKVFSAEEHKTMTIHDKCDLFFHDYNIAALFVQENYLSVVPKSRKNGLLDRIAECADSLAIGDLVENSIRSNNCWSLLPIQACYSSVIPGSLMSGHVGGQINFPGWLGRNAKQGKISRLLQDITVHTRLVTGANKDAINLDYLKFLRDAILRPLVTSGSEGIEAALNIMNCYHLLRDDLDAMVEISVWPGQRDPMQSIETKVKASFTRAYNKNAAPTPFTVGAATKKKSTIETQDSGFMDAAEDNDKESEDDSDTLDCDRMVKAKKVSSRTGASTSKEKTSTSAGGSDKSAVKRGRGRGRGKY